MIEWISKRKKLFTFLFIVIQILYPIILKIIGYKLEDIYYIVQIATAIFICTSGFVAVWQYFFSTRSARIQQQAEQIQKSIDLSEYYKDNILPLYRNVSYVYRNSGLYSLIDDVDKNSFKDFDIAERDQIYGKSIEKTLRKKENSAEYISAVIDASRMFGINIIDRSIEEKVDNGYKIDTNRLCDLFIETQITSLLNNLEYFAMHFTHNTADDTVIYASLHQTYISMVEMLYCNIAAYNSPDKPSFYTNVTELYKRWKEKRNSSDKKIVDDARKSSTHKGNSVDRV